ncbi:MAG: hypothetical protein Q9163_000597 [Psora crenata]
MKNILSANEFGFLQTECSARPSEVVRLQLYGLYKQSMEGDVDGVMRRPEGNREDGGSAREKWEAWHSHAGLSRTEAKRQYISTLIEAMHRYATTTPEARELVTELEFVWDQIKSQPASSSGSSPEQLFRSRPLQSASMSGFNTRGPGGNPDGGLRMLRPLSDEDEEDGVDDPDRPGVFEESERITTTVAQPLRNDLHVRNRNWKERVEQALIKITVEIAALREQMEARGLGERRRRTGLWPWTLWLLWASIRHLLVDAALLAVLILWAKGKEDAQSGQWICQDTGDILSGSFPRKQIFKRKDFANYPSDLSSRIEADLSISTTYQKFMITPKVGILKPPFSDPSLPLGALQSKKIILLAPTAGELSSVLRPSPRPGSIPISKPATPARHRDWRKVQDEATYTFHTIIPLSYLPNPSRSQIFLERLRDDPGIKAAMVKHKFSVGVLTEMNPAEHTTHESRTLGLNRNRGEVIELRLRTDAYDGYRDYKVIRDTLCHELAHNVFGEHDRNFWDLTKSIETEVRQNDWKSGGQALSNEVFYDPEDREGSGGHVDGGGCSGGEFVLGGTGARKVEGQGLERREAMARAAEERMRRQKEAGSGGGGRSSR